MAARHSKHSKHAKENRDRYGMKRPSQTRQPLPIVVIVCDDAKAAVAYFNELKREVKAKVTLNVVPAPHDGATPNDVVDLAMEEARKLQDNPSKNTDDTKDSVWAVIDIESHASQQDKAYQSRKKGETKGVRVVLSKPCFEVWILAHLINTGEAFHGCSAVITRVKSEWRNTFGIDFGPKAQADYAKLKDLRTNALAHSRSRDEERDQSWTHVWKIVDEVLTLCS